MKRAKKTNLRRDGNDDLLTEQQLSLDQPRKPFA